MMAMSGTLKEHLEAHRDLELVLVDGVRDDFPEGIVLVVHTVADHKSSPLHARRVAEGPGRVLRADAAPS